MPSTFELYPCGKGSYVYPKFVVVRLVVGFRVCFTCGGKAPRDRRSFFLLAAQRWFMDCYKSWVYSCAARCRKRQKTFYLMPAWLRIGGFGGNSGGGGCFQTDLCFPSRFVILTPNSIKSTRKKWAWKLFKATRAELFWRKFKIATKDG